MKLKNIKRKAVSSLSALATVSAGAALFGAAVNMFLLPHGIVTGGATGIATALSSKWGIPVGLGIIAVNLPLFALCVKESGISGMVYTIIGTTVTSLAADILIFLPVASEDLLLSSILGGVVMGIGTGLLLSLGFTTGGSDLGAHLIHKRHPSLSVGRMILLFDGVIIVASALFLGDPSGIMYSAVCTVTYSLALDMVQSYTRRAKAVFIISDKHRDIARSLTADLGRGVTLISAEGFYSGKERPVLLCVVGKREEFALRRLVLYTDPAAFMIISDAAAVLGQGFGNESEK